MQLVDRLKKNDFPIKKVFYMMSGNSARFVFQLISFILLARLLRPDGYGALIASLSLVALFAPFVELGGYSVVVKHVSQDPDRTGRWVGNQIRLTTVTAPFAIGVVLLAKWFWLPEVPLGLILALSLGDFVGARIGAVASAVWVGHGLIKYNVLFEISSGILRLILILLFSFTSGGVVTWGILHLLCTALIAWSSLLLVRRRFGRFSFDWTEIRKGLSEGFNFSIGKSSESAYTDLDKVMLAKISGTEVAGLFGAAHRFVAVALVPLGALNAVMYPRYFKAGKQGLKECLKVARSVLPFSLLYGVVASVGLVIGSFVIPTVLGPSYVMVGPVLRLLGPLIIIDSAIFPIADVLTGAGYQRWRSYLQIAMLLCSLVLNLMLIPSRGWLGAVLASLCVRTMLLVGLGISIWVVKRRDHRVDAESRECS